MNHSLSRRSVLRNLAGSAALLAAASATPELALAEDDTPLKGHIHHSVCRWCYGKLSLDELCQAAKKIGIESIDLLGPDEWPTARKYGLICAMCNGPDNIGYGWNRVEHHDKLVAAFEKAIPQVAEAGNPSIITFSGNRKGKDGTAAYTVSDEEGIETCVKGLKRIVGVAEKNKVNLVLELLNSKVDHKNYMADHTAWGVEVCKQVGSERLKLLYDIYHMQIMEGDVIRTIRENISYLAHFHTGGVPGRNEIDDTQELFYPAIMRAIVATGYKGYVAQEFIPKDKDAVASLRAAIHICDV
jgi:hydroxypyruvate isomerase